MKEKKIRKKYTLSPNTEIKQSFIKRTIKNFGNHLLPREQKIFNEIFESFPEYEFWSSLNLPYQLNSLAFLKTERGWELINSEWKKYKFVPAEKKVVELSETNFFLENQKSVDSGAKIEDNGRNVKKSASLREQLNLW